MFAIGGFISIFVMELLKGQTLPILAHTHTQAFKKRDLIQKLTHHHPIHAEKRYLDKR